MWEIIEQTKDVVGIITGGITIFQTGKAVAGGISVFTSSIKTAERFPLRRNIISHRALELGQKVDSITDKSLFLHGREIYKKDGSGLIVPARDKVITPSRAEIDEIARIHKNQDYAVEKVFSSIDELPKGFLPAFLADPDDFITYRQAAGAGMPPMQYLRDPTLILIEFLRQGQPMIGFIKKGYVEQVLNITIKSAISSFTLRNIGSNPFTGGKMLFGDPCYCGSMKKFWACHGSMGKVGGVSGKITMNNWGSNLKK